MKRDLFIFSSKWQHAGKMKMQLLKKWTIVNALQILLKNIILLIFLSSRRYLTCMYKHIYLFVFVSCSVWVMQKQFISGLLMPDKQSTIVLKIAFNFWQIMIRKNVPFSDWIFEISLSWFGIYKYTPSILEVMQDNWI